MRRLGICCVLSLLLIAAVGRAAPLGSSRSASTAGAKLQAARRAAHRPTVLLGNRTIQRKVGRARPGRADAFRFAVRRAGTVSAVKVYLDAHNKAKKLMVGIYSSRSGNPLSRVASGTLSSTKAGSWNKVHVTPVKVRSRSTYWIAVLGRGGTLYFRDHKGGLCHAMTYHTARLASMPAMWSGKTRMNACSISAYAIGRATNGAGAPTNTFGPVAPTNPTGPPVSTGGPAPQVGAPTPSGVTCTTKLNAGANVNSALSAASSGSTVCLNSGSWSAVSISNQNHAAPGVTLAATPGQTVVVPGFEISGSSNLTVEGFNVTQPGPQSSPSGFQLSGNSSGGLTIEYNTIENQSNGYGIDSNPGSGNTQTGVSILYNQLDHDSTFIEVDGNATEQFNWTIAHNVLGPGENYGGAGHYIQIGGITGVTIDNNAFEGPAVFNSGAHNNVFHCFSFGPTACTNVTFDNNIMWEADSRAQSVLITDYDLKNIQIENNLDVEDPACETGSSCPSSPFFVEKANGVTLLHNTSANAPWSINLSQCGDGCISNPDDYDAEYNIATGPSQSGQSSYGSWGCTSSCLAQYNTSQDNTANTVLGGTGNVINWKPNWQNTSWTPVNGPGYQPPPSNYYKPVGLSIPGAGYQGQIGP
jgi:hypothetical protein